MRAILDLIEKSGDPEFIEPLRRMILGQYLLFVEKYPDQLLVVKETTVVPHFVKVKIQKDY
jgi:hypothetical protein